MAVSGQVKRHCRSSLVIHPKPCFSEQIPVIWGDLQLRHQYLSVLYALPLWAVFIYSIPWRTAGPLPYHKAQPSAGVEKSRVYNHNACVCPQSGLSHWKHKACRTRTSAWPAADSAGFGRLLSFKKHVLWLIKMFHISPVVHIDAGVTTPCHKKKPC